jgi:anti-sigma B factor antagonist
MSDIATTPAAGSRPAPAVEIEQPAPGLAVVRMRGEHDLSTAPGLGLALDQAAAHSNVVVDLSECDFIDSSVIGLLLSTADKVRAQAEQLVVVIPPESKNVARVADLTCLSQLIPVHSSRGDAIASLERIQPAGNPAA